MYKIMFNHDIAIGAGSDNALFRDTDLSIIEMAKKWSTILEKKPIYANTTDVESKTLGIEPGPVIKVLKSMFEEGNVPKAFARASKFSLDASGEQGILPGFYPIVGPPLKGKTQVVKAIASLARFGDFQYIQQALLPTVPLYKGGPSLDNEFKAREEGQQKKLPIDLFYYPTGEGVTFNKWIAINPFRLISQAFNQRKGDTIPMVLIDSMISMNDDPDITKGGQSQAGGWNSNIKYYLIDLQTYAMARGVVIFAVVTPSEMRSWETVLNTLQGACMGVISIDNKVTISRRTVNDLSHPFIGPDLNANSSTRAPKEIFDGLLSASSEMGQNGFYSNGGED